MKPLLLLWAVMLCSVASAQNPKLLASCCDAQVSTAAKSFGRCSGDASCTACTSCSSCKHCSKEGGSCGVCAPAVPKKQIFKARPAHAAKSPDRYRKNQMIEVTSETLNVRSAAGTDSKILKKVNQGDMLTFIKYEGEWMYVRVDGTEINGWVNYKFVK